VDRGRTTSLRARRGRRGLRVVLRGGLVAVALATAVCAPTHETRTARSAPDAQAHGPSTADPQSPEASGLGTTRPTVVPDGRDGFLAADAACDWLTRHQSADGSWDLRTPACADPRCSAHEGPVDVVGDTALALRAFLTRLPDLASDRASPAIRRGLDWLVAAQAPDGTFESALAPHEVRDQALVAQTGLWATWDLDQRGPAARERLLPYRVVAERSGDRLLALRRQGGAWSDGGAAADDLVLTTWATLALAEARGMGLTVPDAAVAEVLDWLDTDPGGATEAAAAMRTCCRVALGATQRDEHLQADHRILLGFVAAPDAPGHADDAASRFLATVAASQWGLDLWRHWFDEIPVVCARQRGADAGCACGTWSAGCAGPEGDAVGATALSAMLFDPRFISTYANGIRAKRPLIPE